MAEIIEILYQHLRGKATRKIAESLHVSRNTIKSVIHKATQCGYCQKTSTVSDLERIVVQIQSLDETMPKSKLQAPTQYLLRKHHQLIENYWQQPYMTLRQLKRILLSEHGISIGETSLRRYAKKQFAREDKKNTVPIPTIPGEQAQVDFGYIGKLFDPIQKKHRRAYAFVMTLSHSRYRFVRFVFKQDVNTWIDCHIRAFRFYNCMPRTIILDNLKSGVIKPDVYDPVLSKAYAEFEKYCGFVADPAKVRMPRHKGKVERSITIVKQQVIAGRDFDDIIHANDVAFNWARNDIAHQITRTTGETPYTRFTRDDKPAMLALPDVEYENPLWQQALVNNDQHVVFSGSFYSVPTQFIGETVWLKVTINLILIYHNFKLIKSHVRLCQKGTWQTDFMDFPEHQRDYILKTKDDYLKIALMIGPCTHTFIDKILQPHMSKTKQRKVVALIKLAELYGNTRLEAACQRALTFNNYSYDCVLRILKQALENHAMTIETEQALTVGAYLRHEKEFTTH